MEREKFSSRLGFILISAGCAIGLGNVWRFPAVVGQYGGAVFILIYLVFLVLFGVPVMSMELAVGRASGKSVAGAFSQLCPDRKIWQKSGYVCILANYILMMFYTTVTGLMFVYFIKMIRGDFVGNAATEISLQYDAVLSDPVTVVGNMVLATFLGFVVCSAGLQKGVEKVTKFMMLALLGLISVLAFRSVMLPGAAEGLRYYFIPNFDAIRRQGLGNIVFAALGQALFTLSIGMGTMTVFGSYISRERRLTGESVLIAVLDTFVAITAGVIVIPACFAFGVDPGSGTGLIFRTLPNIFNSMSGGRIWGSLFFLFMIFAAMSTIIGIFENLVAMGIEKGFSRKKSGFINLIIISGLSLPCAFGFNLLSDIQPLGAGTTIMDLEDFIVSNNLLPFGALIYIFFCASRKYGWGWKNFISEVNTGKGMHFPEKAAVFCSYIIPAVLVVVWLQGIKSTFFQ